MVYVMVITQGCISEAHVVSRYLAFTAVDCML